MSHFALGLELPGCGCHWTTYAIRRKINFGFEHSRLAGLRTSSGDTRPTEAPRTMLGDSEPVALNIQGSQVTAPAPVSYSHIESNGCVTNPVFGWMETNLTVLYHVRELNAPVNWGAWVVATAAGSPLRGSMQR